VDNLKEIFGNIAVKHSPARPGDFRGVKVSIEKAKKMLGWKPVVSFETGIRKYVEFVKNDL